MREYYLRGTGPDAERCLAAVRGLERDILGNESAADPARPHTYAVLAPEFT